MPEDPLEGAKRFLAKPSVVPKRKIDYSKDIELPNDTGERDPRLAATPRAVARPSEQPKDMLSNVKLRRSLTGGRR
jgi:hypothetical protein